ncbi:hypothetical protein D0867_14575 [Hortaea werneckii]|nr:hypothetical protein D0867_14575 [Hortaea werneckii]
MRFRAFAKANACGAISSPRAFSSTNIAQEAATRSSNGKFDVAELLSKPSWSVASLLPSKSERSSAPEISSNQLHHLLRLSALPPPKSPEEEQSMLSTLSCQFHFVKDIQAVDTAGVEPLRSLRDETAQGEAQAELGVEALKDALEKESVRGKYHKRIRRNRDVAEKKTRDWDPLATAHKKVGRFFVVEGEKSEKPCGLPLCPLKDVTWQKTLPKDTKAQKGTCVAGSSAADTRASQKRKLDEVTTSTVAKRPRTDETPAAKVRQHGQCRDNPPKSSGRQTGIEYDEHEHERVPPSEGVTCFFWYHGHCSRAATRGCDYPHCLTDPPSMVQPPPGYVHTRLCILPWCPGDKPAKTNQLKEKSDSTKAKKGRPGKKRVKYSLYSKRVDEQEQRDFDAKDDDDQDDVSEAPSCGQELFTGEDWYLKGFE